MSDGLDAALELAEQHAAGRGNPANWPSNSYGQPALAASLQVNLGFTRLYGFSVYNSNAAEQYIQVFDATSLPADGTVPILNYPVNGKTAFYVEWDKGRTFQRGCFICNSSTDTTKTIGAADCLFDAQYC